MLRKLVMMPIFNNNFNSQKTQPSEKINLHIEIVGSSNPRLNALVEGSSQSIYKTLIKSYRKVVVTMVDDMNGLELLAAKKPDIVVLGVKLVLLQPELGYDESPKVWLATYLQERGITVTGSATEALKLEFEKDKAKQVVLNAGLQTTEYFLSPSLKPLYKHDMRYPLFVKPVNRGDSKGIDEKSVVYNVFELKNKIQSIHKELASDAIVETYLCGKEYSVAVVRIAGSEKLTAFPVEIQAPIDSRGNRFLSENVKTADTETVVAVDDLDIKELLSTQAIAVFRALNARDYGRIDMRMDSRGMPNFIEANLMPGLSNHGYFLRCLSLNMSQNYEEMIQTVVELASERCVAVKLPLERFVNINVMREIRE